MAEAYIVDAVRTPMGKRGGGLSDVHPVDLSAKIMQSLVERTGIDPGKVDDVIWGCVAQVGAQAWNIARNAWLSAGFPEEVPGVTIDRQCGSSQQAVHFAAQGVMAGVYDLVVAGGVEAMSLVHLNSSGTIGPDLGFRYPFDGEMWNDRYGDQEIHQLRGGDMIAEKWDIDRRQMEELALASHTKAARAWAEGRFDNEVVPIGDCARDEGIRETSLEKMATLNVLREGGRLTAAVASQITDGSSALLIASADAVEKYSLTPRARIHHMTVVGSDAVYILTGPIPATRRAFEKTGLGPEDIDLYECNEAFASVVLAWMKELDIPGDRVNVNGGAMALGHPLGASGARLMTTLLNELERTGGRYGLQTLCEGGGLSNVTIIARL
jgi:acetyl-CoA C-acetyltransferase